MIIIIVRNEREMKMMNFKIEDMRVVSVDELKEKFNRIVTGTGVSGTVEKFTAKKPAPVTEPDTTVESKDDDDTLSYFAKLADED
mgnify:CR=1 FL=1